MTTKFTRPVIVLAAVTIAVSTLAASPAKATPAIGLSGRILAQTTIGHTDYVLREITIAPGGTTGWHSHDGRVQAVVRSGVLTHVDSDCRTIRTYRAGQVIVEPVHHVHLGRNDGPTPMVLDVVYLKPTGTPLAEDATAPACANHGAPTRPATHSTPSPATTPHHP